MWEQDYITACMQVHYISNGFVHVCDGILILLGRKTQCIVSIPFMHFQPQMCNSIDVRNHCTIDLMMNYFLVVDLEVCTYAGPSPSLSKYFMYSVHLYLSSSLLDGQKQ